VGLLTSLTLSSNVLDEKAILSKAGRPNIRATVESGSYYSVFVLTGPEIAYQLSSEINLHGAIQGGAFIGTSPAYEAFSSGFILSQTRATSSALAFGLSGGAQISNDFLKNFSIGIQYIYTAPRYNLTRFTNGNPVNFAYQQPTSFFLILFGFGL
jgi:hypothetical protein